MKRIIITIILIFVYLLLSSTAFAEQSLQVKIEGIMGPPLQNIQDRLAVLQTSYGHELSSAEVHDFYQKAPENIKKALEPFGYFKASITRRQLLYQNGQWRAYFAIDPGPALPIMKVDLAISGSGKNNPELRKLIANFPLKPGQAFQADAYDKAKNLLFQTANNQGYLQAILVSNQVQINLEAYHAVIILHLNTGPRFYFGPVVFNQTPFSPEFLQHFVTFHQGDPFSSETLLDFQQALNKSRYFENVIVMPDIKRAAGNQVPVNVTVSAPKAKQYNVGLGYGTFTGPRITLGADYRRIGSNGQHFTTQIKLSSVLSGLAAKYFIPGKNPLTDQYALSADAQKFTPKNGQSFSEKFSGSYIKILPDWQNNLSLNYLIERFRVENEHSEVSRILYPSYTLSRIKADNLINPTEGSSFNFNIQGASENILSATNFVQSEIKGKYIFSPTHLSRVILCGDLGYTIVNDLARLPLTLRFFAGGLNSIRGYDFSSIGPGRYLETASVEFQHKIYGDFSGAVFYDAGTATNHFNDVLFRGEGAGIIYNSIIGPVQLYVGKAMSKPGKPLNIQFSIGSDF
ncbi:MAG TPA: BamA/TamA family outer membrane protein [Gammaproteobacteria bacterium]|nr:BamA/TamA family outer membrane protein [Gammaproteobacteria bacterium]